MAYKICYYRFVRVATFWKKGQENRKSQGIFFISQGVRDLFNVRIIFKSGGNMLKSQGIFSILRG